MAFMAHGHMAGEGQYGKRLERANEYVVDCQKANGLVTLWVQPVPKSRETLSTASA